MVAYFGLATVASVRAVGQERMPLRGAATLDRQGYAVVVLFHLILPVRSPPKVPAVLCGRACQIVRLRVVLQCLSAGCTVHQSDT